MTVGIRISQSKVSDNDHRWSGTGEEAEVIFSTLGATGVDFIHTTEYQASEPAFEDSEETLAALAKAHSGVTVIANGKLDDPEPRCPCCVTVLPTSSRSARPPWPTGNWPHLVRNNLEFDELDPGVFAPLADVKDWELEPPPKPQDRRARSPASLLLPRPQTRRRRREPPAVVVV